MEEYKFIYKKLPCVIKYERNDVISGYSPREISIQTSSGAKTLPFLGLKNLSKKNVKIF